MATTFLIQSKHELELQNPFNLGLYEQNGYVFVRESQGSKFASPNSYKSILTTTIHSILQHDI